MGFYGISFMLSFTEYLNRVIHPTFYQSMVLECYGFSSCCSLPNFQCIYRTKLQNSTTLLSHWQTRNHLTLCCHLYCQKNIHNYLLSLLQLAHFTEMLITEKFLNCVWKLGHIHSAQYKSIYRTIPEFWNTPCTLSSLQMPMNAQITPGTVCEFTILDF